MSDLWDILSAYNRNPGSSHPVIVLSDNLS